eukprot:497086_1
MMTTPFQHKLIELECDFETYSQQIIKLKLPSFNDWTKNLESILSRIPKRFPLLSESQWLLSVNDIIINKQDPLQFKELMETIPPPVIIKIISSTAVLSELKEENDEKHISSLKVNYKSSSMIWSAVEGRNWNDNYEDLIHKIKKYFNFNYDNFKLEDNDECEIIDSDDLNILCHSSSIVEIIDVYLSLNLFDNNHDYSNSESINHLTDEIINDMEIQEINTLKSVIKDNDDKNEWRMNWEKACNAIHHEMFPKLANIIRAIINDKQTEIKHDDLSDDTINKVVDILKTERHLPFEERQYLRKLLLRSVQFQQKTDINITNIDIYKQNNDKTNLLMDIFDVHRIFMFFNFQAKEYLVEQYQKDVRETVKDENDKKFIEQHIDNIYERFDLHPNYIINDCMFRVLEYH